MKAAEHPEIFRDIYWYPGTDETEKIPDTNTNNRPIVKTVCIVVTEELDIV